MLVVGCAPQSWRCRAGIRELQVLPRARTEAHPPAMHEPCPAQQV